MNKNVSSHRKKGRDNLFVMNCYMSLRQKREEFRDKLIEILVKRRDENMKKHSSTFMRTCINEEDVQLLRYYHYIAHGISDVHISPLDPTVLNNILSLVRTEWKQRFPSITVQVTQEIQENYISNVKKAIIDFVLQDFANNKNHFVQVF